jgi:hypothetical protein
VIYSIIVEDKSSRPVGVQIESELAVFVGMGAPTFSPRKSTVVAEAAWKPAGRFTTSSPLAPL